MKQALHAVLGVAMLGAPMAAAGPAGAPPPLAVAHRPGVPDRATLSPRAENALINEYLSRLPRR